MLLRILAVAAFLAGSTPAVAQLTSEQGGTNCSGPVTKSQLSTFAARSNRAGDTECVITDALNSQDCDPTASTGSAIAKCVITSGTNNTWQAIGSEVTAGVSSVTGGTDITCTPTSGDVTCNADGTLARDTEVPSLEQDPVFGEMDTETELETQLTNVADVFTDNDGALTDDDLTDDSVGELQDVTLSGTPQNRDVLVYDGVSAFVDRLLVEADISDLSHTTDTGPAVDCPTATHVQLGDGSCVDPATQAELDTHEGQNANVAHGEVDPAACTNAACTVSLANDTVTGGTQNRCARFDGSGNLVSAGGDCSSGDTDTTCLDTGVNCLFAGASAEGGAATSAAALENDALDSMAEIATTLKVRADDTDTKLLTTSISPPASNTCLEIDSNGSVVLASAACGTGSGGTPGTDTVGTDELDDGANSPTAGYAVIVDSGTTGFEYVDPATQAELDTHTGNTDIHVDHTAVSVTAGDGLTGGGDISATRNFAVGAGTGIAVNANDVQFDYADAGASPALGADECVFSNEGTSDGGWVCEGPVADSTETRFRVTESTTTDKIITFPDATGEVTLLGQFIDDGELTETYCQQDKTNCATWTLGTDTTAEQDPAACTNANCTVDITGDTVTGGTASRCARFDGSGTLVAAGGDCSSGDTTIANTTCDTDTCTLDDDTIVLLDANGAAPTTDGEIKYDRTTERIEVGDGASGTVEFYSGAHTVDTDTTCLDAGVTCNFAGSSSEGGAATSAAGLEADALDAMTEIATSLKVRADDTDTKLLTTSVAAPGSATCLEMDTNGSVVLSSGACGVAGSVGTDVVGTDELDDGANTPTAGYAVIVDSGTTAFEYVDPATQAELNTHTGQNANVAHGEIDPDACTNANCTVDLSGDTVTGGTASKCARFDGSGNLVAASGDCSAGDTDTTLSGSAAGGDLSGTYPNPSVNNDSHNHGDSTVANNLTIAGGTIGTSAITLNAGTAPTTDGLIEWDTTDDRIKVGNDGNATLEFYPGAHTVDTTLAGTSAGGDLTGTYPNPTIAGDAVALGTDTTGNYVATVAPGAGSKVTVTGSGSEGAAVTLGLSTLTIGTDTTAELDPDACSNTNCTVDITGDTVTGGTASRCARFDGSGNLVAAGGDCSSGDTTIANTTCDTDTCTLDDDTIVLLDADGAAPTDNGEIKYDRTTERIEVGNGSGTVEFYSGSHTVDTTCLDGSVNCLFAASSTEGGAATTVTVATSTDTTSSIAFFESATGSLGAKTDADLTYDATNNVLTAGSFAGDLTGTADFADSLSNNGANCNAGEIPLGVDKVGAVEGCYEPAFTDVTGSVTDAQVPNDITIDLATNATNVTVTASSDTTASIAFFDSATGNQGARTDAELTYNATTNVLTATEFAGSFTGTADYADNLSLDPADCGANKFANTIGQNGDLSCVALVDADVPNDITIDLATKASTVTVADIGSDTTSFVALTTDATGDLSVDTDAGLTYDASTDNLSATTFTGNLSGNVTGNVTGDVNGNASTATALASDPANCVTATHFAVGVTAAGVAECEAIVDDDIPNDITIDEATLASTVTVADIGGDTTSFVALTTDATGSLSVDTDAGITYNATSNVLTATGFAGNLTGTADFADRLSLDPTDCAAGEFANAIDKEGDLTCATVGLDTLSDVNITGPLQNRDALMYDSTATEWVDRPLVEADISDLSHFTNSDETDPVFSAETSLSALETRIGTTLVPTSQKGVANGVASLDGSAKVPVSQLPDSVVGSVKFAGTWNANTNSPNLTTTGCQSSPGDEGNYYVVSTAGSTNLDGETQWEVGDWAICEDDGGLAWARVGAGSRVTSVHGRVGAVTANTSDYDAAQIDNTAAGNIEATDVQAALNELDSEKLGATAAAGGDLDGNYPNPTIKADAVALGTDTTGDYVATIADAGNGKVTVANSGGETAAVTLDIADVFVLNTGDTIDGTTSTNLTITGGNAQSGNILTVENDGNTSILAVTTSAGNASVQLPNDAIGDAEVANALTIAAGTIGTSDITLKAGTAPTADGRIEWDTTAETIKVGHNNTATLEFHSGAHFTNGDETDPVFSAMNTETKLETQINVDDVFTNNDGALDDDDLTDDTIGTLSDVTVTGPLASGDVLIHNGSAFVDRPLTAADIASGTLAHERGGLEADVSAYNGLVRISGGTTTNITDLSGLNTALGSSIADGAHNADQNLFETFATPSGTNPVADSTTDTLTFAAGTGITISGDSGTDTITLTPTLGDSISASEMADADHGDVAWDNGAAEVQSMTTSAIGADTSVSIAMFGEPSGTVQTIHTDPGLVYDATNNVLTATDHVTVGDTEYQMAVNGNATTSRLAIATDDGETNVAEIEAHRHEDSVAARGAVMYGGRSRGSIATPAAVVSGDRLLTIYALGHDGTDEAISAEIDFTVGDTPGNNDMPGTIELKTSADGSQSPTTRLTIDEAGVSTFSGNVVISATGNDSLQLATGAISDAEVADNLTIAGGTIGTSAITLVQSATPAPTAEGVIEWDTDDDHIYVGKTVGAAVFVPTEDVSGDITMTTAGVTTIQANAVALGTDTTGNYVANVTGATGRITVSGTAGEGWAPEINITADSLVEADLAATNAPSGSGDVLTYDGTAGFTWATQSSLSVGSATSATNATNVAVDNASTDSTTFVAFVETDSSSNQQIHIDTALAYDPTTDNLSATTFTGALSGNATTASTASAGDSPTDFFSEGAIVAQDDKAVTDLEGTGLSISAGTLNSTLAIEEGDASAGAASILDFASTFASVSCTAGECDVTTGTGVMTTSTDVLESQIPTIVATDNDNLCVGAASDWCIQHDTTRGADTGEVQDDTYFVGKLFAENDWQLQDLANADINQGYRNNNNLTEDGKISTSISPSASLTDSSLMEHIEVDYSLATLPMHVARRVAVAQTSSGTANRNLVIYSAGTGTNSNATGVLVVDYLCTATLQGTTVGEYFVEKGAFAFQRNANGAFSGTPTQLYVDSHTSTASGYSFNVSGYTAFSAAALQANDTTSGAAGTVSWVCTLEEIFNAG
jgi:hypothetical protein